MPTDVQLKLDDAFMVKGPDRWDGNTYIHYGRRYGVVVDPVNTLGIRRVRHVVVNSENELESNSEE